MKAVSNESDDLLNDPPPASGDGDELDWLL